MRTEAFLRPATSCAIALAAIVAAAAVGAPGPAFAACGVSSGSSTGIVHAPSSNAGVHAGATGSTHGTSSSSCSTMSNKTVTASVSGSSIRGTTLTGGTGGGHHQWHGSNGTNSHTITATNKWHKSKS